MISNAPTWRAPEDVEVEGGGFDGSEVVGGGLPMDLMEEDTDQGSGEDTDEH